jgi:hypothetical protein
MLKTAPLTVIPIQLATRLAADADQADRNGDTDCAWRLKQLAAYTGAAAPQQARDLGIERCTERYAAARDLMELVVAAEQVKEAELRQHPR